LLPKPQSIAGIYNHVVQDVFIRRAKSEDIAELASMCHSLWPESSADENVLELAPLLAGNPKGKLPATVFLAETADGRVAGFIEVGARSHADGCDPSQPVGFLEGWYVKPEFRKRKIGARLLAAAVQWARELGYKEMASDTWLDNIESQQVHTALGFELVDRCVHYRKIL
jgi:aminoglycoside 6'-N-acetyltransferase I